MTKTELPNLLLDDKAFEEIKAEIEKEKDLQGNIGTIFVGGYCGYNVTVTKFKEENLRAIVINPPIEETNSVDLPVDLEDNKICELTKFFKIKTFTVSKEKTKVEDKLVEVLLIDEVKEEELEKLVQECNIVKIKK